MQESSKTNTSPTVKAEARVGEKHPMRPKKFPLRKFPCSQFNVFSTNQQINVGNENSYHKLPPQTSPLKKKYYYPVPTTTSLGILLETRRGNGHCKFSFNKAIILKRILNIFKSASTGLPCISILSANAVFYSLSIFCWNFLNFVDTKNNFKDFIGKNLKNKQ